jgi:hypothetical protein
LKRKYLHGGTVSTNPTSLDVHWTPFAKSPGTNAFADLQTEAAITAEPLRFDRAADNVSLSTDGQVFQKTVVSEVTTIGIQSNTAYDVTTESAQ